MSDLRSKINSGDPDINNINPFFSSVIKAAIWVMNQNIKVRGIQVPHFIISTGDDIMYRELLNYYFDNFSETGCDCECEESTYTSEVTGEDFIYNKIPRCMVDVSSFSVSTDQLTQPYVRSNFEIEYDGSIREFCAETFRLPINFELNLKYYLDNFSDSLSLIQYIYTTVSFVRNFHISYLGQDISCSMRLPDSHTVEKNIEVDFNSDDRSRTVEFTLSIETNLPIYNAKSAVETSSIISSFTSTIYEDNDTESGSFLDKKGGSAY